MTPQLSSLPQEILENIYVYAAVNERITPFHSVVHSTDTGQRREVRLQPICSKLSRVSKRFKEISIQDVTKARILVANYLRANPVGKEGGPFPWDALFRDPSLTAEVAKIVLTMGLPWAKGRPILDEIYLEFASTFNHPFLVTHYAEKTESERGPDNERLRKKLYSNALIQSSMTGHDLVAEQLLQYVFSVRLMISFGADVHHDNDTALW